MKRLIPCFIIVIVFSAGCSHSSDGTTSETPMNGTLTSMKGWEIYSWQVSKDWYYSLVMGTNRIKTFEEISSPSVAVLGLEALNGKLAQLAVGQQVFWSTQLVTGTAFPSEELINAVKASCAARGLKLTVLT